LHEKQPQTATGRFAQGPVDGDFAQVESGDAVISGEGVVERAHLKFDVGGGGAFAGPVFF